MQYFFIIEQTELFQEVQYKLAKNQIRKLTAISPWPSDISYMRCDMHAMVSSNQTVLQPKALLICALLDTHIYQELIKFSDEVYCCLVPRPSCTFTVFR
jgi:hypothetical protein